MKSALLHHLEIQLGAGLNRDARRTGRTEAMARVLLALEPTEGIPMGEMARRMGRDPSTATRFVDRAVAEGLAAREQGADRRRRLVFLTSAGREARARLLALRDDRARVLPERVQSRTGLGPGEVEWFLQALVDALAE